MTTIELEDINSIIGSNYKSNKIDDNLNDHANLILKNMEKYLNIQRKITKNCKPFIIISITLSIIFLILLITNICIKPGDVKDIIELFSLIVHKLLIYSIYTITFVSLGTSIINN